MLSSVKNQTEVKPLQPSLGTGSNTNSGSPGYIQTLNSADGAGDMVPRALLDERIQELLAKDETIQVISAQCRC